MPESFGPPKHNPISCTFSVKRIAAASERKLNRTKQRKREREKEKRVRACVCVGVCVCVYQGHHSYPRALSPTRCHKQKRQAITRGGWKRKNGRLNTAKHSSRCCSCCCCIALMLMQMQIQMQRQREQQ